MEWGKHKGRTSNEELTWLRQHAGVGSINLLFQLYTERYGAIFTNPTSFAAWLWRVGIHPTSSAGLDLFPYSERLFRLMLQGPVRWEYYGKVALPKGKKAVPHWLWKYHAEGYKQGAGAVFANPPYPVKERQFVIKVEVLESGDPHQGAESERVYQCLPDELPQGEQHEAQVPRGDRATHFPSAEDAEAGDDRLSVDREE